MGEPEGIILEIQRMSTEDGPGIRTTLFFKGCPLRCSWCHNPESIAPDPEIQWIGSRCIGCRTCVSACPAAALRAGPNGIEIDRALCTGCGVCAEACPSTAMELLGKKWSVTALLNEIVKDRVYFESSGGGITLSGGEPTLQAAFATALLAGLRERGIQTALDTCGQCSRQVLATLLPHTDLVLYDLKEMDAARHKAFTGVENGRILENFSFVRDRLREREKPGLLWVRTPIIPGVTDDIPAIAAIGRYLAAQGGAAVARWELCAFNSLCRDKYRRLDRSWDFTAALPLTEDAMTALAEAARNSGIDPEIVHWSGATRLEGGAEKAKMAATEGGAA